MRYKRPLNENASPAISTIPLVVAFLVLQRYFIKELSSGALKG